MVELGVSQWLQAEAMLRLNRFRPARAKLLAATANIHRSRVPTEIEGELYLTSAGIFAGESNSPQALVEYLNAYRIFTNYRDARKQSITLQDIGNIYRSAGSYERALYYFSLAVEADKDDRVLNAYNLYNKAVTLSEMSQFAEARGAYKSVYDLSSTADLVRPRVLALNGMSYAQIRLKQPEAAQRSIDEGLAIVRANGLTEYRALLVGNLAELELLRGRPALAQRYAEAALTEAGAAAETQASRPVQWTAYRAYKQQGDTRNALRHFEILKRLDDEGKALAASTNAALLAAQFDFANQNARIASLRAGQLERDLTVQRLEARQRLIITTATIAFVMLVALGMLIAVIALRRSRNRTRTANALLTSVNAELTAALNAKTQFLATTSHEIRTPLNGVLGMTQILLADRALPAHVRERVTLMQGAGEAMRGLIDDILDFAKLDAGKLEINPLELDLPRLLDETVAFWRGRASEQGLVLSLDRAGCPPRVLHDGRRLQQIVANLLSNAIKFTSEGKVAVRVTVAGSGPDERLELTVNDSGIGIPAAAFETIFEKFRQLDSGTTRRFGGTGLGLAISRTLARAMGGDITVASTLDAGSVFTLSLPANRVAAAQLPLRRDPASAGPTRLAGTQLLLVGANPAAQGMLRAVIAPRVAGFAAAYDVGEAFQRIASDVVDLVLVDGTELAVDADAVTNVCALPTAAPGVRVAVLWPAGASGERELVAAGVAVIHKPVAAPALLAALEDCLGATAAPRAVSDAIAG